MITRLRTILAWASAFVLLAAAGLWYAPMLSAGPASAGDAKAKSRVAKKKTTDRATFTRQSPGRRAPGDAGGGAVTPGVFDDQPDRRSPGVQHEPRQHHMQRADPFDGDVRALAQTFPIGKRERPEREGPDVIPVPFPGTAPAAANPRGLPADGGIAQGLNAPAPTTSASFDGLDFATWGAGHPPDTNGDVGPTYYIQTMNTSIGIFEKVHGTRVAAFTFNTFMSQGHFGNLCDTDNFGDPVVLYDTFEDRWIITDFAFKLDGSGNVMNPPGSFQCFAVSKSGDPVSGGWNYYWINTAGGLGDYPKFGIWPDGLYMSVNMFGYPAGGSFQNVRLYALNKAQMYAGAAAIQVVSFDAPSSEFTMLPSNARLQAGTPPAGSPNYFATVFNFLNVVGVWKFHVDWNSISTSTLTGPFNSVTATSWSQLTAANGDVPSPGNSLDTLYPRLMMQNQYSNIGGVESLWDSHSVGAAGTTSAQSGVRYYQVKVTGGTVEANATQAFTHAPDTTNRYMASVAVDRVGDMAIGYTTSTALLNPALKYAGRLAGDPLNSLPQTEATLFQGTGSQSGTCGGAACTRWGDYSAMTLDPDGCTFWYTNEYYLAPSSLNDRTRIGAFSFPSCTTIGSGTLQGTVKSSSNAALVGATVTLGSRTATTDAGGTYAFAGLPAGTYPSVTASFPGYDSVTVANVAVPSGSSATQNFVLTVAPLSNCLTDTTEADFQFGVPTNCDLTGNPGAVTLLNAPAVDQQNTSVTANGFGINTTSWAGQTFTPAVTGKLTRVDLDLFCSSCTGTTPNITVSIRATSGGAPITPDLATATITGFSSGSGGFLSANFSVPPTLTAGTRYAIVFRPVANPSAGTYAYVCSCTPNSNPYANGQIVQSNLSGANNSWSGSTTDMGFKTYMQPGFAASGTFVSSLKDANPPVGGSATWGTISFTASTPANTTLKFQAAASNSVNGPFNFVGPDGTAGSFFASGASLAQFNGFRYLKYEALLTTTNSAVTPTINDVTVCYANVAATTLAVSPSSGIYGGTTTLSASLTAGGSGVSGKTISFTLRGSAVGSAITNATGVATLSGVSLAGINAGSYLGAVTASFAGDATDVASGGANNLTVSQAAQTIAFGPLPNKTFGDPDFTVSATATSGLAVAFAAAGNCTMAGNTVHLTGWGSCTITASQAGNANYTAAPNVQQPFSIALTISPQVVAQALLNGANRLGPPLQHGDGGWYFLANATNCGVAGAPPPSCRNLFGINGLGLLEAYKHNTSNTALLAHAEAAGDALAAIFNAENSGAHSRPYMQDIEFLGALAQTSGNSNYMTIAANWFAVLVAQYPSAATRVDAIFATRDKEGFRTYGAWDAASLVRAARAAGNVSYATDAANRIVAREVDLVEGGVTLPGWKYTNPATVPPDNPTGWDYTLLGEGSMLISIFDLPGFAAKRAEYLSYLLSQQDPAGTWDGGDLQMTAYIVKGLIALGDASANTAIALAETFFANNQQPNGGWPFFIAGSQQGDEDTEVDAEVMAALATLYNTPPGSNVPSRPSALAALQFSTVTTIGTTTVTAIDPTTAGNVPTGFSLAPLGYDASTTAGLGTDAGDGITLCVWVPAITDPVAFANLRLLHNEAGTLVDRTLLAPDALAPNFATRTVCASVTSLSRFALAVLHQTPPAILAPPQVVVEATGPSGAVATFDVTATDAVDGAVPVTCVPASGSVFRLGDTGVRCSASNSAAMIGSANLTVRVQDTVAPAIVSVTPAFSGHQTSVGPLTVTLGVIAQDLVDPAPHCAITTVTASDVSGGHHERAPGWRITGPLTVRFEGEPGKHRERRYTITVGCTDASGNASSEPAIVTLPSGR
jgi:hypothetical protein